MSMTSTQKPNTLYQVRQSSVTPPQKHNINPMYQSCQKMRMSIIDQLSPIKDLPINNSSQRGSFYQVRGKSNGGQHPSTNKTQPSRLMDSTSFNTTLNYTHDSQFERKSNTIPKGVKINNFEILKDQLRFALCQLDDLKKSFDRVVQSQFDQVIQVIRSSSQLSNQLIEDNILLRNQICTLQQSSEYDKLKGIMEQLQSKITLLMGDNSKLNHQITHLQEENNKLQSQLQESDRRLQNFSTTHNKSQTTLCKENLNPNISNCSNKSGYSQRELAYKLEQAEIRLLTLQISNDNLRQQLQHNQLDYQGIEQLKETISALEIKSQAILNQKDSLQQENELLNQKIQSLEKQVKESSQKSEYIIYIHQLENDIKSVRQELNNNHQTITSLNNTINQLMEQVNIMKNQKEQLEYTNTQQTQQYQSELQQAGSRYQVLWQEISEMRERLEQRQIQEESGKMLSHAEKALFETQISNLNDKLKDYEQIFVHFEQKSRNLEQELNQYQQECQNYKLQIEKYNNQIQNVNMQCNNNIQMEIQEMQWKISQLNQIIMRKDKEYQNKSEELQQLRAGYDQLSKKNQSLEMRILYFVEQEVKSNAQMIKK